MKAWRQIKAGVKAKVAPVLYGYESRARRGWFRRQRRMMAW
jgi:hypothetical protein